MTILKLTSESLAQMTLAFTFQRLDAKKHLIAPAGSFQTQRKLQSKKTLTIQADPAHASREQNGIQEENAAVMIKQIAEK